MKKTILIGDKIFNTKKEALAHFKSILNAYDYGERLTESHFLDVQDLLQFHPEAEEMIGSGLREVRVDEVRYKTKCFRIIRMDSSSEVISYTKCINGKISPLAKFRKTCRDLVNEDLRGVKLAYFKANSKKGRVKCQETGDWCFWEELSVDHRQPNTFSVIVDRFIELNRINIELINYLEVMDSVYEFKDKSLCQNFREYHRSKANLRLIKKKKNLGRSHLARIGRQGKDLVVK